MTVQYVKVAFYCESCGRKAQGWDARVPATHDERKCGGPVSCGHCSGTTFRAERIGKAAA